MSDFFYPLGFVLLVLAIVAALVVPLVVFTTVSQTYLISNPTYEQLQALSCHKVCREDLCGSRYNDWLKACSGDYCIRVHDVELLGTMEVDGVTLQSIKVTDRNRGKLDKFVQAVGVDYLKIGGRR